MNTILKYKSNYCVISNTTNATYHKHWFFQLFVSYGSQIHLDVEGESIVGQAILVNMDTPHSFDSDGFLHMTLLVDPRSSIGSVFKNKLNGSPYLVLSDEESRLLVLNLQKAVEVSQDDAFKKYVRDLCDTFEEEDSIPHEQRVEEVLTALDGCVTDDHYHKIETLAETVFLSESRVSHLFKQELGIPLKSFIVLHKLQKVYTNLFNGMPITEAAISGGFDSPSHFASTNKAMTGMSASAITKDSVFLKVE